MAVVTVPITYPIVQRLGLRKTVVWCGVAPLTVSTAMRCVSKHPEVLRVMALVCGGINGWTSIMIEGRVRGLPLTAEGSMFNVIFALEPSFFNIVF